MSAVIESTRGPVVAATQPMRCEKRKNCTGEGAPTRPAEPGLPDPFKTSHEKPDMETTRGARVSIPRGPPVLEV